MCGLIDHATWYTHEAPPALQSAAQRGALKKKYGRRSEMLIFVSWRGKGATCGPAYSLQTNLTTMDSDAISRRDVERCGREAEASEGDSCERPSGRERLHRRLAEFNHGRLAPVVDLTAVDWDARATRERACVEAEIAFVERERRAVHERAQTAPSDPDRFVAWFEALERDGEGQHDVLFDFLAHDASLHQMRWFLRQEVAGEAGFDDLVALTQIKMPPVAKLEMGRNYWDELGQGHPSGMHGPLLDRLAEELAIEPRGEPPVVWESLALANLMVACAIHRRYAFASVGTLGVIELTAPGRAQKVNEGLKRLGVSGEARRYFALHATLDVKHAEGWNRNVLRPLVAGQPAVARLIAEGALMRLRAGARCFERYRRELAVSTWGRACA